MAPANSDHTPLRYTLTGNHRFRKALLPNPALAMQLATEIHGIFIGPFPPRMVMGETMKISDALYEEFKKIRKQIAFRVPKKDPNGLIKGERTLYEAFVSRATSFTLAVSSLLSFVLGQASREEPYFSRYGFLHLCRSEAEGY